MISLKSFGPVSAEFQCDDATALPSLSAKNDNKTGNINDKNCSLSIVLTAMDQKLQKS